MIQGHPNVRKIYAPEDSIPFGKFKGILVGPIIRYHPSYICWCLFNVEDFALTSIATKLLNMNCVEVMRRQYEEYEMETYTGTEEENHIH